MDRPTLRATLKRLLGYIRPYWLIVITALFCTFLVTIAKLSQAKFIGVIFGLMSNSKKVEIIDPKNPLSHTINGMSPFDALNFACVAFLGMMVLMGVATYFTRYLVNLGGQLAIRDMRQQVFNHLQRLPMKFFGEMRLGEIQSRASGDVMAATQIYNQLADFVTNLLLVVIAMSLMVYNDWQMTLVVLLISPLIGKAIAVFGHRVGVLSEHLQSRAADLAALIYESLSNIKVVKAYSREDFESSRFESKNFENYETQMGLVKIQAQQAPVVEFLGAFGIAAIIWFGAMRIIQGQVDFQKMTEYWTLMVMTTQPINALSGFYSSFQASAASARRVFEILDTDPEGMEDATLPELPPVVGEIAFDNVDFGYSDENIILKKMNLTIKAGEVIAIVGSNGAGKTTLMNLVSRFYDPNQGSVSIDGHDLRKVRLSSLRKQIGVVIQESMLFAGSIAENIASSDWQDTPECLERCRQAALLANADNFIVLQPQGYKTEVGERGARLSGGQRQRIAIARALFRNPRILLLDEFTSNVDAESENSITDALSRSLEGRTCLVIAHRLNTIRHAHRILVIDHGQIVEQGSHDELIQAGGPYGRIFHAQLQKGPESREENPEDSSLEMTVA